jgi:hypothetical protein
MIIDTSLQSGVQIRKGLIDFTGYLCDDPNLLGVCQTGKGASDFIGLE